MANFIGIETVANMMFFLGMIFLLVLSFNQSTELSKLNKKVISLTQELAILKKEKEEEMPHSSNDKSEHVIYNEMPEKVDISIDDDFMAFWDEIHELRDDVKKSLETFIKCAFEEIKETNRKIF